MLYSEIDFFFIDFLSLILSLSFNKILKILNLRIVLTLKLLQSFQSI